MNDENKKARKAWSSRASWFRIWNAVSNKQSIEAGLNWWREGSKGSPDNNSNIPGSS
jgi:hypothetical protein